MNYKDSKLKKIINSKWSGYALLLTWVVILIVDIHNFIEKQTFGRGAWVAFAILMIGWITYTTFVTRKNA